MAIDLNKPLAWSTATGEAATMLTDLQNNILDGHGRKATRHLFINFTDAAKGRAFLASLAPMVHSARKQLDDAKAFRSSGKSGGPIVGVHLSSAGYDALGLGAIKPKPVGDDGGAFEQGMLARAGKLNDPAPAQLEAPYRNRIHAMVLIGADPDSATDWQSTAATNVAQQVIAKLGAAGSVIANEQGRAIFSSQGPGKIEGIEHFGYVDGRSQPLMLRELVEREHDESDGAVIWSPEFPIGQVLVPDPGSPHPGTAFGSFFVFRKLEQRVAKFKDAEAKLGQIKGPGGKPLGELAGAMLVGRFEDGTPVTLQREDGMDNPVANDFDYRGDMKGLRCPFSAHIRKTNPRGDTVRLFQATGAEEAKRAAEKQERSHIMARRGMTYGTRNRIVNPDDKPQGGVGLMFMAFQCNLANQFEFTQQGWANEPKFVTGFAGRPDPGRDPIIGQRGKANAVPIAVRDSWGNAKAAEHAVTFDEHVLHRGGEYFFTPSISMLAALATR